MPQAVAKLSPPEGFPVFEGDLFSPDVLADSLPAFREIRSLGDVVWMPRHEMFGVGRFKDVQAGLRASDVLISSEGVTANMPRNRFGGRRGVLTKDGEEHENMKRVLMKPLMPKALHDLKQRLASEAAAVVLEAADGSEFEAMSRLASHLPTRIVSELVGLNEIGHQQLLRWSNATFNAFGPTDNSVTRAAEPIVNEFVGYALNLTRDQLTPGSWAEGLFAAADRGEISIEEAHGMIFDYATPSLDTTILATGEMLWQLATVEGAFEAVRSNPDLIPSIVYESVRMATPIRGFTRFVQQDFAFSERVLPAGSRVWLLNASANRDERHYPDPDRFDLTRNPRDHVGWGYGKHLCAGMHLARLEMETLLSELVRSVSAIKVGKSTRLVNNGLQGYHLLPLTLQPA